MSLSRRCGTVVQMTPFVKKSPLREAGRMGVVVSPLRRSRESAGAGRL
jgi:hypothetical protein